MILQRDRRLRQPIKEYGCYYMSILYLVNKYTNYPLTIQKINGQIYFGAVQQGFMNTNCYVQDPSGLCKWLGWNAVYTGNHESPDYKCGVNEAEILYFHHKDVGGHFVVGDGAGHVAYDPWGVSRAASQGGLKSKRIFRF